MKLKVNLKNTFIKHKFPLATFFISFIIMLIGFAVIEISPFGKNQIMIVDSWHQYYPFLQELHDKLRHGESIFYSWRVGMGSNFYLIMAYYAFSPLYLLSILFPAKYLREFLMLVTVLKIALAGSFFTVYLKHTFKREDYTIVGFGLLYAFCGYAMGYYWNVMWLDAVALLPLIILGLGRIIDGKGFTLYTITLALALISNFYIGFFVCEFILIYYLVAYLSKTKGFSIKHFISRTVDVALFSALAIGIAAVVLLPTYKGLLLSHAVNTTFPEQFTTYFSSFEILNNLLPGTEPSTKSGLPNIYSGFIGIYFLVVFFVSSKINIKDKIASFLLSAFLVLSFNINILNYIWHAFHFPNEVPYRFAFVFSFLVLSLAYKGFESLEELPKKHVWFISLGFLAYLLVNERLEIKDTVFYTSLGALGLYTMVLLAHKYDKLKRKGFVVALSTLFIAEALLSAIIGTTTTGYSSRENYPYLKEDIQDAVSYVRAMDDDVYRTEMIKWYSTNDPALYGYMGASMFSSTVNANISRFNQKLGLGSSPESNRYLYASSTPIVNGLMGVKYFFGRDHAGTAENAGYTKIGETGKVSIYQNDYPLPLGFMVDDLIYNWNNGHKSPFKVQEDFILAATGLEKELFEDVQISSENYVNMQRTSYDGFRYAYKNLDAAQVGNATLFINAPETKQMYIYMFANRSYKTKVTVNEKSIEYETRRGLIIDLGVLEKGTEIKLDFEVHAADTGYFNLQAVTFDEEAYKEAYALLADEPLNITKFEATKVEGTVVAKKDGVLYTSIPYENGWTVKVDGEKVVPDDLKRAMIGIYLTEGSHKIEMSYMPDGFVNGLIISLFSLGALILVGVTSRKSQKKEQI